MRDVAVIPVNMATNVFQDHGVSWDGSELLRKKLSRLRFSGFTGEQPSCPVALEGCACAHPSLWVSGAFASSGELNFEAT